MVGLTGNSSVLGTIEGDLRSPDSSGGGHVQTANKGGTGQTSYTKGDLLVATSTSVLSKFAVSSVAGQVLTVDPSQAAGIKWGTSGAANNIYSGSSVVVIAGGQGSVETVLFSASILGSTLGTNKAIHYSAFIDKLIIPANGSLSIKVKYGNNQINAAALNPGSNAFPGSGIVSGFIDGFIINKSISSQIGTYKGVLAYSDPSGATLNVNTSVATIYAPLTTASIESSADQNLVITGLFGSGGQTNSVLTGAFIIEKIS